MATRRDQLQSYQYLIQRVLAAFVMRETDPAQSPLRRGIGAIFGGVMITVLVGAGFGVYGILTKVGSDSWKSDGSVVIEKETGASFVYFDGRLHPALNYSSALLAAGSPTRSVSRVAGKALASVPRGLTVGIAGAPNSLPGAGQLLGLPWTVCAAPGRDDTGQPVSTVTLVVSRGPDGAEPLGERGVLVGDTGSGEAHLVWHGHRHRLREPENVVPALFGELVTAVPAGTAWLNALPVGAEIGPIVVADRGRPSGALPDRAIGDVLVAETGSGPQHYLVFDDGLAPITELQK
ncbi:MAG: type VII secretion protein EccB, partial [Natronosporangium sp.]